MGTGAAWKISTGRREDGRQVCREDRSTDRREDGSQVCPLKIGAGAAGKIGAGAAGNIGAIIFLFVSSENSIFF